MNLAEPKFDDLPQLVLELIKKIDHLSENRVSGIKEEDYLMSTEELMEYLPGAPARQTIYGWINGKKIPFEKHGKRLYFRKSKIDKWIANGRQK